MTDVGITLKALIRFTHVLEVGCRKCGWLEFFSIPDLIRLHGASKTLPALRQLLAEECRRQGKGGCLPECGVHYPKIADLFSPREARAA